MESQIFADPVFPFSKRQEMFLCGNGFCLHVKAETSPVQSMGRLTFFSSQMSRHPCTDLSKAERFFYVVIASQTETFYKGRLFCFCSEKQNGTVYILTDTAAERKAVFAGDHHI